MPGLDESYHGEIPGRLAETVNALETALKITQRLHFQAVDRKLPVEELQVRAESARIILRKAMKTLDGIAQELWERNP